MLFTLAITMCVAGRALPAISLCALCWLRICTMSMAEGWRVRLYDFFMHSLDNFYDSPFSMDVSWRSLTGERDRALEN